MYELMSMQDRGRIDSTLMVEALAHVDTDVKTMAIVTCGMVKDSRFTSGIIKLAGNKGRDPADWTRQDIKEWALRNCAVITLGEIGDVSAIPFLHEFIKREFDDINLHTKLYAIESLGKIGNESSMELLRSMLGPLTVDSDETVMNESAFALWRLGDTLSIPALKSYSKSWPYSGDSNYALFRLAPDSCTEEFLWALGCAPGVPNLTIVEKDYIQSIAARGLGDGKDTTAILQAFDNCYGTIVRNAKIELARGMGKNKVGRERLEKILPDIDDNGLKRVILIALGQIGDSRSFDLITAYLDDSSLQVRLAAISSLPQTSKKKSLKYLKDLRSDPLWQIRAETARAYGKAGSRTAEKRLKEMLTDKDDRVKAAVIEALGEYSVRKNIDIFEAAMFGAKDIVVKSIAADILGNAEKQKALDLLIKAAGKIDSTESIDFCRSLVTAMGNYVDSTETGQSAVEAIRSFLNHHNRIVRQDAVAALKEYAPADFDPGEFDIVLDRKHLEFIIEFKDLKLKMPVARIKTSRGEIVVILYSPHAPRTVANFIKLANRKFYDGLTFHRVVQNFVVQGGCPRGDGWGDPGYMIREEINSKDFERGTIGMATSGRDTGGSQFFFCLSDQPHLDGRYTSFGHVKEGWDVLDSIEMGDTIYTVTIEKGR